MKQAILLAAGDELKLLSGSLDELQYFPALLDSYLHHGFGEPQLARGNFVKASRKS